MAIFRFFIKSAKIGKVPKNLQKWVNHRKNLNSTKRIILALWCIFGVVWTVFAHFRSGVSVKKCMHGTLIWDKKNACDSGVMIYLPSRHLGLD